MGDERTKQEQTPPKADAGFLATLGISSPKRIMVFFGCIAIALAAVFLLPAAETLTIPQRRALFILVLAAGLWVSEAIPAFAVGILVIGLEVGLLGSPRGGAESPRDWEQFVAIIGHPLIWLFFGGFVLAAGLSHTRLDRRIASGLLGLFGERPAMVLLGVMSITFTLSMFMSNTATTAMILAMLGPVFIRVGPGNPLGRGMLIGIAFAANVGGMGTLIGSPPNAIAVGALNEVAEAKGLTFLQWMGIGLPIGMIMLAVGWVYVARLYPSSEPRLDLGNLDAPAGEGDPEAPLWQKIVVTFTVILTVGLWMTSSWHPIPTAAVSFIPIVFLTTSGVLDARAMRGLNYDVLFLMAGGLALGQVVMGTGLSDWIVARLPLEGLGFMGVALVMSYVTVVLSNFMSNTAASNILVPIGITMLAGVEAHIAVPIALSASAAMCLPISTPPNALAFASGRCETRDFLKLGLVVGLLTPPLAVLWSRIVLDWML